MTDPTPPLGLDDLRVTEPVWDSESVFDPASTWERACGYDGGAIARGHAPEDVAACLMELSPAELADLRMWWESSCLEVAQEGYGRDASCDDLPLCGALDAAHPNGWPLPLVNPASVLDLLDEMARLKAQIAAIPEDAIGLIAKYADAFFCQSKDDDGVSAEEQDERDEGEAALDLVNAWLVRP